MVKVLLIYLKERFPLVPVLLFSLGYASLAIGVFSSKQTWLVDFRNTIITLLLLAGIFFFFLLRQRVTDEFKDAAHDLKNFPGRPVPSGLISKEQLTVLGSLALAFELVLVYLLGMRALLVYSLVFLYSLLMAKEFFISRWLNRHFSVYFLSHEVIFVLFGIFFVTTVGAKFSQSTSNLVFPIGVLTASPAIIEIIRKFKPRYDKHGKIVADSYSTVWGRNIALLVLIGLTLFIGFSLSVIKDSSFFIFLGILTIAAWLIFSQKSDKAVILIGAASFLGFALISNLI